MVRYTLKTVPPGLPPELFTAGFQDPEIARVIVGSKRTAFHVCLKHLCALEYFRKAFGSKFIEGQTKIIHLDEDNEEAFSLFLDWLYHGFNRKDWKKPSDCVTLTKLFMMLDRFCILGPLREVGKRIWNSMQDSYLASSDVENKLDSGAVERAHNERLRDCYRSAEDHYIRFLVVHRIFQESRMSWRLLDFGSLRETDFTTDIAQWRWLMMEVVDVASEKGAYTAKTQEQLAPELASLTDKIVMPLLFKEVAWPAKFIPRFPKDAGWARARNDPRTWYRGYFKM